jgi:penicillin-binding protein 1A
MPAAGKTGTPQNWSDAWAVGYTPYYTTAIWFGFDKPGNSLGVNLTGSTLAGPVWGDYMREIHQGLPLKDFVRPSTGIIDVTVCAKSGLLKTPACNEGEVTLPFLEGTQPTEYCNIHGNASYSSTIAINTMRSDTLGIDEDILLGSLTMPFLNLDLLPESPDQSSNNRPSARGNTRNRQTGTGSRSAVNPYAPSNRNRGNASRAPAIPDHNPLLDDEGPALSPEDDFGENGDALPGEGALLPDGNSPAAANALDSSYGLEMPSYNPLLD